MPAGAHFGVAASPRMRRCRQVTRPALLAKSLATAGTDAARRIFSAPAGMPRRCRRHGNSSSNWLECRDGRAFTLVTQAREPRLDARSCRAATGRTKAAKSSMPAVPHFLPQPPNPDGRRLTRLDLARWLIVPRKPAHRRAFVNRLWKQFFGTGLSGVVDDLGAQGEWPVHPDLLDWLAVEFVTPSKSPLANGGTLQGWDVKHVVKLMVMSATYRQDSDLRPELRELDPNNRLLATQIAAPARSGVRPRQRPVHRRPAQPRHRRPQHPSVSARRLLRQHPVPQPRLRGRQRTTASTAAAFTCTGSALSCTRCWPTSTRPAREECTASRTVSNTPQQALTLLNDPSFVEAARVLAQKLLRPRQHG